MKKAYITPNAKMVCIDAETILAYSNIYVDGTEVEEGDGSDCSNRRGLGGGMWDDM